MENRIAANYEDMKNNLFFQIMDENEFAEKFSENDPHVQRGDLYLVPYVKLGKGSGLASFSLTRDVLDELGGISNEQVLHDTEESCERVMPRRVDTMKNILGSAMPEGAEQMSDNFMTIVTNSLGAYGAATLFYEGVLDDVAKRVGGDYFVLPSSKHEVICIPVEGQDVDVLRTMVYEINRGEVAEEDRLSDNVYLYSTETKEFSVA